MQLIIDLDPAMLNILLPWVIAYLGMRPKRLKGADHSDQTSK